MAVALPLLEAKAIRYVIELARKIVYIISEAVNKNRDRLGGFINLSMNLISHLCLFADW